MQRTIAFDRIPGSKKLFLDWLAGKAAEFYRFPFTDEQSFTSVQRELSRRSFAREKIVEVLLRQNDRFGADALTNENIRKLADSRTTAVFTGQQVTVFGGPMFVFYKAALAVKVAAGSCRKLGQPVVPIFWLAADDADFDEVARTAIPTKDEEIAELIYQPHRPNAGQTMGNVILDEGILGLLDQYEQVLPDTEFRGELMAQLREFYRPGESIVTAFGKYLSWLFRGTGLILVDPSDPELRRMAVPVFTRELQLRERASATIQQGCEKLESRGYHLQVTKPHGYSNLFYCKEKRTRINFATGGFEIEGKMIDQAQLEAEVDANPSHFAPNVFLRPVVQSHIFPTLIYFAGPAEAAYFAQMHDFLALHDIVPPIIYPRFSATIIEPAVERLLEKHVLTFEDCLRDAAQLTSQVMKRTFSPDIEPKFAELREQVRERLTKITESLDQSDHGLVTNATRIAGRIDVEIRNLEEKVFQAHRKKNQTVKAQLERIAFSLYPGGQLQERVFPINYYIAKYGRGVVDRLLAAVDCDSSEHHLVPLDQPVEESV